MSTPVRNIYDANMAGSISGLADTAQGGQLHVKIMKIIKTCCWILVEYSALVEYSWMITWVLNICYIPIFASSEHPTNSFS